MNTCKNCKYFNPNKDDGYMPNHGICMSGKLLEGPDNGAPAADTACGGGMEGYGDYIIVGKDFGCIHFESKLPIGNQVK